MNEIENRQSIEKNQQMKTWFFEKINKIDKPLARLRKTERTHSNKRNERENINTDAMGIKRVIKITINNSMPTNFIT